MYRGLESSAPEHLPVAHKMANEVIPCQFIRSKEHIELI